MILDRLSSSPPPALISPEEVGAWASRYTGPVPPAFTGILAKCIGVAGALGHLPPEQVRVTLSLDRSVLATEWGTLEAFVSCELVDALGRWHFSAPLDFPLTQTDLLVLLQADTTLLPNRQTVARFRPDQLLSLGRQEAQDELEQCIIESVSVLYANQAKNLEREWEAVYLRNKAAYGWMGVLMPISFFIFLFCFAALPLIKFPSPISSGYLLVFFLSFGSFFWFLSKYSSVGEAPTGGQWAWEQQKLTYRPRNAPTTEQPDTPPVAGPAPLSSADRQQLGTRTSLQRLEDLHAQASLLDHPDSQAIRAEAQLLIEKLRRTQKDNDRDTRAAELRRALDTERHYLEALPLWNTPISDDLKLPAKPR